MELSREQKDLMLGMARHSISSIFSGEEAILPDLEKHPILNSKLGVFVTLTTQGRLRGCIGYIESDKPLYQTLSDAAKSAARHDPRFAPLTENDLEEIKIEISILSEPFPMKNYDEIEIGKHGLILEEQGLKGLLLPQVPVEHNMKREEYLDAICNKTGFHSGLWKDKVLNISLFTATVFSEE